MYAGYYYGGLTHDTMSNVMVVPGASPKKLPFVHSNFKPTTKPTKAFAGYKPLPRARHSSDNDDGNNKLPRLTFNTYDRRTTITFGAVRRGRRREYPGFVGHSKILKQRNCRRSKQGEENLQEDGHNERNHTLHGKNADDHIQNSPAVSDETNLTSYNNNSTINNNFINVRESGNAFKPETNSHLPDLDSLFICDDNDSESNQHLEDSTSDLRFSQTSPLHVLSSQISDNSVDENAIFEKDPFARQFGEKLKEARGKSGMKRGRKMGREKELRVLGDVITDKRLRELLSPRIRLPSLNFVEQ